MNTPDITPGAITALVLGVLTNVIVLVGLNLSDAQKGAVTGLVTAVVLAAFLVHDAIIRSARAKNVQAIAATKNQ